MRVVHVESGRHLYGGAGQAAYLIDGLAKLGIDNVLLCRPGSAIARVVNDCQVVEVPMWGELDFGMSRRLRLALGSAACDVLHAHSRSGVDRYAGIAARRAGRCAVLTRRVDSRELPILAMPKYARYARIAAISTPIRAQLIALGVDAKRVECISSAVDAIRFAPSKRGRAAAREMLDVGDDEIVIGSVGQLIPRKSHATLIAAMPRVLERYPTARLLIFGRGPLERRLGKQITRLGLAGRVRLLGHQDSISEYLAGLDLYVHPAKNEALGVAILEAMSMELAVVACRVGGIIDVIADGENGRLIPPGQPVTLAESIIELIADPAGRASLGRAARASVIARHSVDRMANRYVGLYESALADWAR